MNYDEDRRNKILANHPNLFPQRLGFDHGDGWLGIIEELCDKLEEIIIKEREDYPKETFAEDYFPPVATQIKEKFGALRFYMAWSSEGMENLIREAEKKSKEICEYCGKPGYARNTAWITTLCDDCAKPN